MYGESYTGMSKAQISPRRCSCELRIDAQQFQDCVCDVIEEMQKKGRQMSDNWSHDVRGVAL
jgi:hypothetical protein